MGDRVIITSASKEYDEDVLGVVHGAETQCGDGATVCGIYFVDGAVSKPTRKPIECQACINVLNSRGNFKHRGGKWY